jgi:hypothetical protein
MTISTKLTELLTRGTFASTLPVGKTKKPVTLLTGFLIGPSECNQTTSVTTAILLY